MRPPKFKTPEDMQERIDLYFELVRANRAETHEVIEKELTEHKDFKALSRDISDTFPTVTGLCIALGMTRQALLDYQGKPEFLDTIKKAKMKIENAVEQKLFQNNATGAIFNLKNNFSWEDASKRDITSGGEPIKSLLGEISEREDSLPRFEDETSE